MIIFTRVDNRLIHGQVVQAWLPSLKVDEVVVISDMAAGSSLMGKMFRMSLPSNYGLKVCSSQEASQYLKEVDPNSKIFILAEDLGTLSKVVSSEVDIKKVNIGNTKYEDGKKEFCDGVFLGKEEIQTAKEMSSKGIIFDIRALPSSLPTRLF